MYSNFDIPFGIPRLNAAGELPSDIISSNFVFVNSKDSFPAPVLGVITLLDNVTYYITTTVDLLGDRLVFGDNTTMVGGSSENCILKSTGLVGTALITSNYSIPLKHFTIEADIALDLDADPNNSALDWMGVNFTNCNNIGTIKNYVNCIFTDCAFLNSGGLVFDGTIGTVAFLQNIFNNNANNTMITLASTLVITRRFRVIYSSMIILSGEQGIEFVAGATVPNRAFILDNVAFSGGSTSYIVGKEYDSNESNWVGCTGITNTYDSELINVVSSTGLISGGAVTLTGGIGFSVALGQGVSYNDGFPKEVNWSVATGSTLFGGDNYISIDPEGVLQVTATFPDDNHIKLGYIITNAGNAAILGFSSLANKVANPMRIFHNFIRKAIGSLVVSGNAVSEKPNPNELELDIAGGEVFSQGEFSTLGASSTFSKYYTSTTGLQLDALLPNEVNVTQWNDTTQPTVSALVTMTALYWKKDMLVRTITGTIIYVYGTAEYATEQEAIDAALPDVPAGAIGGSVKLCGIVIQKNATSIAANIIDIRPILQRIFDTGLEVQTGGSTSHSSLTGLANDDHIQYHNDTRGDIRYYTKTQIDARTYERSYHLNFLQVTSGTAFTITITANDRLIRSLTTNGNTNTSYAEWIVPQDFLSFPTGAFSIDSRKSGVNNTLVATWGKGGVADSNINALSLVATATGAWETKTATPGGTYAAGDRILITVTTTAANPSAGIDLGSFRIKYNAR